MLQTDSLFEKMNKLKSQGTPFALATVVRCESPTSAKPGAKAIIDSQGNIEGWIGGGCAQPAVISTANQALKDGKPRLIRVSPTKDEVVEEGIIDFGMTCHSGGTLDIFIEPVLSRPVLMIIGASPAAQALSGLASRTGFSVTAVFPGANANLFPDAAQTIDGLDLSSIERPPFVVVATQGKRDEAGLEAALSTGSPSISFIASARKAEKMRNYLKERGLNSSAVDAIISPAGIEIGAVTPEEIALSVLASLVKTRREADIDNHNVTQSSKIADSDFHTQGLESSAEVEAIDPICGMRVEIAGAEFQTEYSNQHYYFCCGGCLHLFEKSPEKYLSSAKEKL